MKSFLVFFTTIRTQGCPTLLIVVWGNLAFFNLLLPHGAEDGRGLTNRFHLFGFFGHGLVFGACAHRHGGRADREGDIGKVCERRHGG